MNILYLKSECFGDRLACLGRQIASVIREIDRMEGRLEWYVSDIDYYGYSTYEHTSTPVSIGKAQHLVTMASGVHQFLSGVFVGVLNNISDPKFREGGMWTEDGDELPDDAFVEVRAFDASYILVLSLNKEIINHLECTFKI